MGNEALLEMLGNITSGTATTPELRGIQAESLKAALQPAQPSLLDTVGQALGAALPLIFASGSEARGLAAPTAAQGFTAGQEELKNRISQQLKGQLAVGELAGNLADKRDATEAGIDKEKRALKNRMALEVFKGQVNPSGTKIVNNLGGGRHIDFSADAVKSISASEGVIASAQKLMEDLDSFDEPRILFSVKGENFKSTKAGKLYSRLDELATALTKINQGSRPSDLDMKVFMKMTKGSFEVNPQDVKELVGQVVDLMVVRRNAAIVTEAGLKDPSTQGDIIARAKAGEKFLISSNDPSAQGPVALRDWVFQLPGGKTVTRSELRRRGYSEEQITQKLDSDEIQVVGFGGRGAGY